MPHARTVLRLVPAAALLALAAGRTPAAPDAGGTTAPPTVSVHLKDGRKVPLFAESSEHVPVARAGDEVIVVRDLADALGAVHASHGEQGSAPRRDPLVIVERLVDLRLMAMEARAMGIADLPQYRAQVEAQRTTLLRDSLKEAYTRDLKPDPEVVLRNYRDAVREWKVRSLLFAAESDARELESRVRGGASFEALGTELIAQRKAQGSGQADLLPEGKMLPAVLAALRKLKPGEVSPVLKVDSGFTVMLLEAIQYPDRPEEWERIQWDVLQARHNDEIRRQYQALKKKHARVDEKLLGKLDFEAKKPGIKALLQDKRPLVRIAGEAPVTVADLAQEIEGNYFHGVEQAVKSKRPLNLRKETSLDNVLARRLFLKEAQVRKIQETSRFRSRMRDYENGVLVGAALDRAVVPGLQVTEEDERAYYRAHPAEYTSAEVLRLEGLAFSSSRAAQAAIQKLRAGTDFKFLAQNAEGRIEPRELVFDGSALGLDQLSGPVQKSLAGARSGDYRLHQEAEAEHHVIHVLEVIPPRVRPFEEVRADARKKASGEKMAQAVKEWVAKLRQAYPVEVYLARVGE